MIGKGPTRCLCIRGASCKRQKAEQHHYCLVPSSDPAILQYSSCTYSFLHNTEDRKPFNDIVSVGAGGVVNHQPQL